MRNFLAVFLLMAANFASATGLKLGSLELELDTDRGPRSFDRPTSRKNGFTYNDVLAIEIKATMTDFVVPLKTKLELVADTEMAVEDVPGLGTILELELLGVAGYFDSPVMGVACDSQYPKKSDADCEGLLNMVGSTETLLLDDQGNPLEVVLPNGQVIDLEHWSFNHSDDKALAPVVAQSQQLFKLIPDKEVQPGDSWDVDVDLGALGTFQGTSSLEGYTNFNGHDCAAFSFDGTLRLDVSGLAQVLGFDIHDSPFPDHMADAKVTKTMVWDYNDEIARVTRIEFNTTFTVEDVANPHLDRLHIPVDVVLGLSTDITARPDRAQADKTEVAQESYALLGAALANHDSLGVRGTSGRFPGRGTLLGLFGAMAVAGLMVHRNPRYMQYEQLA